jgi:hypothetical protein
MFSRSVVESMTSDGPLEGAIAFIIAIWTEERQEKESLSSSVDPTPPWKVDV